MNTDVFTMDMQDPFLYNAIDNIVGPSFVQNQGFLSPGFDFDQQSYQLPGTSDSWAAFNNYGGSYPDAFAYDQGHGGRHPQNEWQSPPQVVSPAAISRSAPTKSSRSKHSSSSSSSSASSARSSQAKAQRYFDLGATFMTPEQHSALESLNNHLIAEGDRSWSSTDADIPRIAEVNKSVSLLCDLMDSVLDKYRDGQYQSKTHNGKFEANITIMMALTSMSRVLKIYRAYCQMLIDDRSAFLSVSDAGSPSSRPSLKRKPSTQVQIVAQLAIAMFNLQHLERFFHAPEFNDCVQPAIIEFGTRCLQDLQGTIRSVANDLKMC